ncbi:MAG TPA: hypothetical protein VLC09_15785 [Polyangiaceae bacterium]|nr:hypothetical protein [Polyangiaceae bacterium]
MKNRKMLLLAGLLGSQALACSAPNKMLIGQTFVGDERSIKILMTKPSDEKNAVVDQYVRVCSLRDGQEVDCKDSLVLQNVKPGSLN